MKKIFFVLLLFATIQTWGQTYDTIYCRSDELYYSEWYDTALPFWDSGGPCCLRPFNPEGNTPTLYKAVSDYTEHPLRVRGLGVMHTINYNMWCMDHNNVRCSSPTRVPEYVRLYQGAGGDSIIRLAHLRWDTAKPQVLKLPKKQDTSLHGFEYAYLYRVYFDTPVIVDSVFYIAGSNYNNIYIRQGIPEHIPTYNVMIGRAGTFADPYVSCQRYHNKLFTIWDEEKDEIGSRSTNYWYYGPFFPIVSDTNVQLILHSADSTMGSVLGGGWYMDSTYATIRAVPERGFRFTHWDDGVTENPRRILMTHYMEFTAYFEEWTHILNVNADVERGSVTGGGTYRDGDTATIAARAWNIWKFVGWDDGDTTNPRQVVVTQDTSFTALFLSSQGIGTPGSDGLCFALTPNPTQGNCLLVMENDIASYSGCRVTVTDAQGREVLHCRVVSQTTPLATDRLAAGVYLVTLTTPKGTASQRLVVKNGK